METFAQTFKLLVCFMTCANRESSENCPCLVKVNGPNWIIFTLKMAKTADFVELILFRLHPPCAAEEKADFNALIGFFSLNKLVRAAFTSSASSKHDQS